MDHRVSLFAVFDKCRCDGSSQMARKSPCALFVRCDVAKPAEIAAAVDAADKKFHRIDGLVNCVGDTSRGTLEDTTVEQWDETERFGFVAKRDFLSLLIAIGMVANQFEAIYWLLTGLVHLATLAVLTTHYRLIKVQQGDAPSEMQSQAIPTRPTAVNREEIA